MPLKYFVVHADAVTQDGLVVRISFSNLFKEFKSTSTWLQFPFVCHAASSSINGAAGMASRGVHSFFFFFYCLPGYIDAGIPYYQIPV